MVRPSGGGSGARLVNAVPRRVCITLSALIPVPASLDRINLGKNDAHRARRVCRRTSGIDEAATHGLVDGDWTRDGVPSGAERSGEFRGFAHGRYGLRRQSRLSKKKKSFLRNEVISQTNVTSCDHISPSLVGWDLL